MKKLNTWINYTNALIILFLFLLGSSEITSPAFLFFLTLSGIAISFELFLVKARKAYVNELMAKLEVLERRAGNDKRH